MERPTKGQVDAALSVVEESWTTSAEAGILAAEVRALRDELAATLASEARLREELAEAQNGYNDHAKLCREQARVLERIEELCSAARGEL